ncbi:unnamed protein product [Sphagnum balticum]
MKVISSFVGDIHKVINTLILVIYVWFGEKLTQLLYLQSVIVEFSPTISYIESVDLLDINRVNIGDYENTGHGKRPELPAVVIEDLRSLLESCWHKSNKGSNSQRSGMLCFVNYGIKLACLMWHKRNHYLMIRFHFSLNSLNHTVLIARPKFLARTCNVMSCLDIHVVHSTFI